MKRTIKVFSNEHALRHWIRKDGAALGEVLHTHGWVRTVSGDEIRCVVVNTPADAARVAGLKSELDVEHHPTIAQPALEALRAYCRG